MAAESGCNMNCNGNATQTCGGPNRLSVYSLNGAVGTPSPGVSSTAVATSSAAPITGWTSLGCYVDSVGARTLSTAIYTIPGENMTPVLCTAACKSGGYILSGVEYGGECYCGNSLLNGAGPAPDGNTGCNMACNGNAAYKCGGANRMNLWSYAGATSSSAMPTSSGAVISSSSKTSSKTSSASPLPTGLPTGWTYKGCWLDQQHGRILADQRPDSETMTVQSCINACIAQKFTVAGMEYHTQCFCGNAMIGQAVLAASESECNTPCGGNTNQICGGGDRMSIYSNQTTLKVNPVPTVQKTGLPGSWNYTGCITYVSQLTKLLLLRMVASIPFAN